MGVGGQPKGPPEARVGPRPATSLLGDPEQVTPISGWMVPHLEGDAL